MEKEYWIEKGKFIDSKYCYSNNISFSVKFYNYTISTKVSCNHNQIYCNCADSCFRYQQYCCSRH